MKKQREYTIVQHEELEYLIRMVNEMLAQGWKCQGGISQGDNYLMQAMVK